MKTTSFELSKRLDKLGVNKKSCFTHYVLTFGAKCEKETLLIDTGSDCFSFAESDHFINVINSDTEYYVDSAEIHEKYAAYTLDEILEMLPYQIEDTTLPYYFCVEKGSDLYNLYECGYFESFDSLSLKIWHSSERTLEAASLIKCHNENPAEAAGELLVWCIENGHVKVEDL